MIGVLIFFGFFPKLSKYSSVIIMAFFTVLTLIDALTNKVDDCGCFGDAIKLTNWQTFWKNIVLDVLLAGIILIERKMEFGVSKVNSKLLTSVFGVFILFFSIYSSVYEPVIDFRAWEVGNQMVPVGDDVTPPISYAKYKNNSTGEVKEFTMEKLMEEYKVNQDFSKQWTFIDSRVENTNTVAADGFSLTLLDMGEEDETIEILSDTTSDLYMITSYNLLKANEKGVNRILDYCEKLLEKGNRVLIVTASNTEGCAKFLEKYPKSQNFLIYSSDDKSIKTILRSNPGLIQISKGKVKAKWSWRNLPK
jgi:triosephosphate isomerase